jgi:hypothetical protein
MYFLIEQKSREGSAEGRDKVWVPAMIRALEMAGEENFNLSLEEPKRAATVDGNRCQNENEIERWVFPRMANIVLNMALLPLAIQGLRT